MVGFAGFGVHVAAALDREFVYVEADDRGRAQLVRDVGKKAAATPDVEEALALKGFRMKKIDDRISGDSNPVIGEALEKFLPVSPELERLN